ncbi:heme exporter protein CcmB [Desulfobacterota bacterium AH_259_B03_O07]|nr:heme exporter protein CcmB [Desulfobacterota bacterium AH_259_B03_O07]
MRKIFTILWKDIVTELRTKELLSAMFTFSLIILLIFNFAFSFSSEYLKFATPAILWVTFTFAGILGLGRSFAIEKEGNSILGLLLTPVDRSLLYFGKLISNLVFVFIVELITLALFVLFFNYSIFHAILPLSFVIILGTLGFVSVGTLFSAIAINTKLREVLLPILLFPIIIPVIVSSVKLTASVLEGNSVFSAGSAIHILVSFDIIFIAACAIIFEYVLEES